MHTTTPSTDHGAIRTRRALHPASKGPARFVAVWAVIFGSLAATGGGVSTAAAREPYHTAGTCGGFPRIELKTPPGLCVGLVSEQVGFARGVAVIGASVWVLDMGGWNPGRGRLLRLGHDGHDAPEVVLDHLNEPNALVATPNGHLLIGELQRIVEFDPTDPKRRLRVLVRDLPGTGRHPLTSLVLTPDGGLVVNIGSASDHCESAQGRAPERGQPCAETQQTPPRAALVAVPANATDLSATDLKLVASGLRNSMALAVVHGGQIVAAENARDWINQADPRLSDEDLPHDTLNWIEPHARYEWPYCYDMGMPSPEYPASLCSDFHKPTRLLPAHAAPLGMLDYKGSMLAPLKGSLVIGYHGYRKLGHRIVALDLDAAGAPGAAPRDIVSGWEHVAGQHPQGSPVGLAQAADGSVFITEDHNGTLLRLASTP
jgi:glucose/arabinose dehydrogenase